MTAGNIFPYEAKPKQRVIILGNSQQRCDDFTMIADACDCTVIATDWQLGNEAPIETLPAADYLLVELLSVSENPEQSLSELAQYLDKNASQILLWTDMGSLDSAYATLPAERSHFLVNANDVDAMPILSGTVKRMAKDQLHDRDRPVEYGSLHKISDELAQFARTLAQMAERDQSRVSDKPVSFRPAPSDTFQRFVTDTQEAGSEVTAAMVRQIIKLRRLRDNYFAPGLFADPAWDILLDLMAARLEGGRVSVSSLCIAAAVPATTALRWIGAMTESGLLVRQHDPDDARRIFIALSAEAAASLDQYLTEIQKRQSVAI